MFLQNACLRLLAVAFLIILPASLKLGAAQPYPIPNTEVTTLVSNATGKTYRITVYAPPQEADKPAAGPYPVIYVLDALWHFARVESLRSALVFDGQMPECIVVGIDYPASVPDVLKLRQHDLTFGHAAEPGASGGAPAFLDFLTGELAPWVESRFPVSQTDRTLVGHSYAGHFALYAWTMKPGFYGRVLAGSPYWNKPLEELLADGAAPASQPSSSRLDVSSGLRGLEYDDCVLTPAIADVITAARARLGIQGETRFALYPDLKHAAIAHPIYTYGLPWLFADSPGVTRTFQWGEGLAP